MMQFCALQYLIGINVLPLAAALTGKSIDCIPLFMKLTMTAFALQHGNVQRNNMPLCANKMFLSSEKGIQRHVYFKIVNNGGSFV
ncbi:hypothetical protein FKM82_010332 [Ascaphus truei]